MRSRTTGIVLLITLLFTACERAIDFKLDDVSPKLVVEATIENGRAPVVVLSNSLGFFSTINPATLANSFVRNAEVYVSNGTLTHRLKEFPVTLGSYSGYYYSNDPASPANAFVGELNGQYSLRIVVNGKEYTAVTTIPAITKRVDSLYWKPAPPGNDTDKVAVMGRFYDPPGLGDYVRYFTKRNNEPFFAGYISVYDDQVIDGSSYDVQVERGFERNYGGSSSGFSYFDKGDTVTLKLCNIDRQHYDFWRTMEYAYVNGGNPFSTPTKVMSNIQGGGLGYFGGLAAQYHSIIIPQ